jgi:hypothetical protein
MPEPTPPRVPRLAFAPEAAAEAIGVSRTSSPSTSWPTCGWSGSAESRLVPVKELERWLDRHADRVLDHF